MAKISACQSIMPEESTCLQREVPRQEAKTTYCNLLLLFKRKAGRSKEGKETLANTNEKLSITF